MARSVDTGERLPAWAAPPIRAPAGLRALLFAAGGEEFVLLEWPARAQARPAGFGTAESEVLRLLEAGLGNAEIARVRHRSPRTVANQVARIYRKLGVRSRLELFALLAAGRRSEAEA